MKRLTDEQLDQQLLSALSTPPQEGLTYDFSAKLHRKLNYRLQRENRRRFYLTWGIVFVFAMAALFFGLMTIDQVYRTNIIPAIAERKWIFIIGFIVVFLIQYGDYHAIKLRQIKKYQELKDSF